MQITSNITSLTAQSNLARTNNSINLNLERLSSGLRINKAADDAAGLAISEKMRAQVKGLSQAQRNAQDGISLIQTAEGALNETHSILQRMRELAVQSSNDTNTDADRAQLQKEFDQLTSEIDRISDTTQFNTKNLLDGTRAGSSATVNGSATATKDEDSAISGSFNGASAATTTDSFQLKVVSGSGTYAYQVNFTSALGASISSISLGSSGTTAVDLGNGVTFTLNAANLDINDEIIVDTTARQAQVQTDSSMTLQIGANNGQNLAVGINDMSANGLGLKDGSGNNIQIDTQFGATAAIRFVDNAIDTVSGERAKLGAVQNRLEHTVNNLSMAAQNITSAESRVRDVDMAREMSDFTKNQILNQAGTAMLAQANQRTQGILSLFR